MKTHVSKLLQLVIYRTENRINRCPTLNWHYRALSKMFEPNNVLQIQRNFKKSPEMVPTIPATTISAVILSVHDRPWFPNGYCPPLEITTLRKRWKILVTYPHTSQTQKKIRDASFSPPAYKKKISMINSYLWSIQILLINIRK